MNHHRNKEHRIIILHGPIKPLALIIVVVAMLSKKYRITIPRVPINRGSMTMAAEMLLHKEHKTIIR
jgi:hypothetical protein